MYKEKIIKINNIKVNYKIFGEEKNPVFLILHGWGWSSDSWIDIGEKLSSKFFVIIPDLPWFWKTIFDKVYTLQDYADFVKDFLSVLNIKEIIMFWHSNGWAISILLAWNIKIKKLILNNSAWIRKKLKTSLKRRIFQFFVLPFKIIRKIPWWDKLREIFYRIIWWHDYLQAEKNEYKKQTFLNIINTDLQDKIKTIKEDTLLIWWRYDTYTPLKDGEKIHKLIINSKIVIIDSTHGIHLKKPDDLVKVLEQELNF